jgi:hypothetical protein
MSRKQRINKHQLAVENNSHIINWFHSIYEQERNNENTTIKVSELYNIYKNTRLSTKEGKYLRYQFFIYALPCLVKVDKNKNYVIKGYKVNFKKMLSEHIRRKFIIYQTRKESSL